LMAPWSAFRSDARRLHLEIAPRHLEIASRRAQVRGQIVCPIFATPALVAASRAALVERMGEEEAKTIMGKHPCVLTCGDGLLTADPDEIRRFAELRRVLDAIPPQALLGTVAAIGVAVLGKIILIKTGNSDPMG